MRRKSFRDRGRAIGRGLAAGFKGTAIASAAGAGTYFVHDLAQRKIEFLGNRPWVAPVGLIFVGHMMKQRAKLASAGTAVCGAGGYALGNALSFMMKTQDAEKAAAATTEAKGLVDQETGQVLTDGVVDGNSIDFEQPAFSSARSLGL
jgi:hypothetical protein